MINSYNGLPVGSKHYSIKGLEEVKGLLEQASAVDLKITERDLKYGLQWALSYTGVTLHRSDIPSTSTDFIRLMVSRNRSVELTHTVHSFYVTGLPGNRSKLIIKPRYDN